MYVLSVKNMCLGKKSDWNNTNKNQYNKEYDMSDSGFCFIMFLLLIN